LNHFTVPVVRIPKLLILCGCPRVAVFPNRSILLFAEGNPPTACADEKTEPAYASPAWPSLHPSIVAVAPIIHKDHVEVPRERLRLRRQQLNFGLSTCVTPPGAEPWPGPFICGVRRRRSCSWRRASSVRRRGCRGRHPAGRRPACRGRRTPEQSALSRPACRRRRPRAGQEARLAAGAGAAGQRCTGGRGDRRDRRQHARLAGCLRVGGA
jgi:hypothetical protein